MSYACKIIERSLKDANACVVNETVLLQYYITSGEEKVEFKVTSHGNSRNSANNLSIRQQDLRSMQ